MSVSLKNLKQMFRLFETDPGESVPLSLIQKLQEWHVLPPDDTFQCPFGSFLKLTKCVSATDGFVWHCEELHQTTPCRARCYTTRSLRDNTFFEKTNLTLYQVVMFSYLWLSNSTIEFLVKEVELTHQFVKRWDAFHTEVLVYTMVMRPTKIGGLGTVVEIAEFKFEEQKCPGGNTFGEKLLCGGVEIGTGRCFLFPIESRRPELVARAIMAGIKPETIIFAHMWEDYNVPENALFHQLQAEYFMVFNQPLEGSVNLVDRLCLKAKSAMIMNPTSSFYFEGVLAKFLFDNYCKVFELDPFLEFVKIANEVVEVVKQQAPPPYTYDEEAVYLS